MQFLGPISLDRYNYNNSKLGEFYKGNQLPILTPDQYPKRKIHRIEIEYNYTNKIGGLLFFKDLLSHRGELNPYSKSIVHQVIIDLTERGYMLPIIPIFLYAEILYPERIHPKGKYIPTLYPHLISLTLPPIGTYFLQELIGTSQLPQFKPYYDYLLSLIPENLLETIRKNEVARYPTFINSSDVTTRLSHIAYATHYLTQYLINHHNQ